MRTRYILLVVAVLPVLYAMLQSLAATFMATLRGRNHKCPRCGCNRTRWSLIRLHERLLFPAFVLPRRCVSCLHRFYCGISVNYTRRARAAEAAASVPTSHPMPGLVASSLTGDLTLSRN